MDGRKEGRKEGRRERGDLFVASGLSYGSSSGSAAEFMDREGAGEEEEEGRGSERERRRARRTSD